MTRMTLAIPSKGRLKDNAEAWLAGCGLKLRQVGGARGYQAEIEGLDADVMLLSAREIATGLIDGTLHLGVTGQDLLHDLSPAIRDAYSNAGYTGDGQADASVVKTLGFGGADVVVAVPKAWLDVSTMADLEAAAAIYHQRRGWRLRVATKYLALTRAYFARHAVGAYRIVESAGATEAAPAAGTADAIVDITSTGATLEANGLKVLDDGVILRSQAALAGSLKADWSAQARDAFSALVAASEARDAAGRRQLISAAKPVPDSELAALSLTRMSDRQAVCNRRLAREAARTLAKNGYGPTAIHSLEFIFEGDSDVAANFFAQI
ncbi:MAG: ATP phosphoribosyltransferase [Pseudomonadota bacterium]